MYIVVYIYIHTMPTIWEGFVQKWIKPQKKRKQRILKRENEWKWWPVDFRDTPMTHPWRGPLCFSHVHYIHYQGFDHHPLPHITTALIIEQKSMSLSASLVTASRHWFSIGFWCFLNLNLVQRVHELADASVNALKAHAWDGKWEGCKLADPSQKAPKNA